MGFPDVVKGKSLYVVSARHLPVTITAYLNEWDSMPTGETGQPA